jgi:hypothetical protein
MQKYNLYLVVSEDLTDCSWGFEPPEKYRICELVNARNKSQATYLAWQNDGNSGYDFRDKPKFSTSIKIKDTGIKVPCIVTDFVNKLFDQILDDNHLDNIETKLWMLKNEE